MHKLQTRLCANRLSLHKLFDVMTISYQWLLKYLPVSLSVDELSVILTSIGLEVEAAEKVESIPGGLEGLVIGEVKTCERHPNADKLSATTVDVGTGTLLNIVCGAPNVAAGQRVVVATVGTTVHPTAGEPFLIKKAKIRGADSEGMICAEDEIGLGQSHAGIMILPADAPLGQAAKTYFNVKDADFAVHIGLTPNRSDANSHLGVAKDVCAYLCHHRKGDFKVVSPETNLSLPVPKSPVSVEIVNTEACPRYAGLYIQNVTVKESPDWLKQSLQTIGVRSINNIVDITNYVLHAFGQPLHAFDADKLKGNKIIVRTSAEGEKFVALDDKERTLKADDIVICDAEGIVALGGVFGGAHSGISDTTKNVFLESAFFAPKHIRRTSLHHGLRTDAALHFEKGVDINFVLPAMKQAAALICELADGQLTADLVDVYPTEVAPVFVKTTFDYINKLSGKQYEAETVKRLLSNLGFGLKEVTNEYMLLQVPTNKTDVSQPADIVEEVLRIDGLDNVFMSGRLSYALSKGQLTDRKLRDKVSDMLCGLGLQEIVTNSIVNSKYYPGNETLVRMINSLTAELDVMRPSLLESGLEVVNYNCNRKNQDLALYEFGNIYSQVEGKYHQESHLGLWITGAAKTVNWNQKVAQTDIYGVKGLVQSIFSAFGLTKIEMFVDDANGSLGWKWKNKVLATVTNVAAPRLKEFDIKQEVFFVDMNWELFVSAVNNNKVRYTEIPKYPIVNRDLAIVLDKTIEYQQVAQVTNALKLEPLMSFGLFDIFESDKLGAGKKSLALNYSFRLNDRTLTDAETEQLMQQLIDAYSKKLNAQVRI